MKMYGDLRSTIESMRTLLGLKGCLIKHKTLGINVPLEELRYSKHSEKLKNTLSFSTHLIFRLIP